MNEDSSAITLLSAPDYRLYERLGGMAGILLAALILYASLFFLLRRWTRKKEHRVAHLLKKNVYYQGLALILAVTFAACCTLIRPYVGPKTYAALLHGLYIAIIVASGILLLGAINLTKELIVLRSARRHPGDYTLRKVRTRYQLLQRMLNLAVLVGIVSAVLMTFEQVRNVGNALLASAGLVGLILGFAAQKSLGTIFAGIQIAISQPIRIDDTVVVEGEFGTVGEITLTYAVVHTWDGRRIIVPINYFLENTFENWTRISPEVVGKVKLYVDYSVPVDELRDRFNRWLDADPLWDRQSSNLLVTGATENAMEIRLSMSARNSDDAWTLECRLREKLIVYLRQQHPHALPRMRVQLLHETGERSATPPTGT